MGGKYTYKPYEPLDKSKALMVDVPKAAEMLGMSVAAIYRLVRSGEIPHARLGKSIRIPRAKVMALIEGDTEPKKTN